MNRIFKFLGNTHVALAAGFIDVIAVDRGVGIVGDLYVMRSMTAAAYCRYNEAVDIKPFAVG